MAIESDILSPSARERIVDSIGAFEVIDDLSWGLVDTVVLHARTLHGDVIIKTAGAGNSHIAREMIAHRGYTKPLVQSGRTARTLLTDDDLRLLVLEYQAGELVQGSARSLSPNIHRQAGDMLRLLHGQEHRVDPEYTSLMIDKAELWLTREHRIVPAVVAQAQRMLGEFARRSVRIVPTHGDWHERNWLVHDGFAKAIDFGRFAFRTASSDLCRLAVNEWKQNPSLEKAFFDGYGEDPREPDIWRLELLCEAIGTAAWAYQVKDYDFEAQGHRLLTEALSSF